MSDPPAPGDARSWEDLALELEERRAAIAAMGGVERVDRQHGQGKLTVRERLALMCDEGTFVEYGALADHMDPSLGERTLPGGGVVTGVGEVDGRRAAIAIHSYLQSLPENQPSQIVGLTKRK